MLFGRTDSPLLELNRYFHLFCSPLIFRSGRYVHESTKLNQRYWTFFSSLLESSKPWLEVRADFCLSCGIGALGLTTAGDPLSQDALQNLRFYKYSSIDKSPLSYYVLRHYVCLILRPM